MLGPVAREEMQKLLRHCLVRAAPAIRKVSNTRTRIESLPYHDGHAPHRLFEAMVAG